MLRASCVARTSAVQKLVVNEKTNGKGEKYDSKFITFQVATDRGGYYNTKIVNGKEIREKASDFIMCRANGHIAQLVSDHLSDYMKDPATGKNKLVSRHVFLTGHMETFIKDEIKEFTKAIPLNGGHYRVTFKEKFALDKMVFVVDNIEFLDSKNKPKVSNIVTESIGEISVVEIINDIVNDQQAENISSEVAPEVVPVTDAAPTPKPEGILIGSIDDNLANINLDDDDDQAPF